MRVQVVSKLWTPYVQNEFTKHFLLRLKKHQMGKGCVPVTSRHTRFEDSADKVVSRVPFMYFQTFVDAANKARGIGLIRRAAVDRVVKLARRDLFPARWVESVPRPSGWSWSGTRHLLARSYSRLSIAGFEATSCLVIRAYFPVQRLLCVGGRAERVVCY